MKTALEILTEARALLSDRSRWIQGNYHRNVDGVRCYCAVGAVHQTSGFYNLGWDDDEHDLNYEGRRDAGRLMNKAAVEVSGGVYLCAEGVNDGGGVDKDQAYTNVMRMFDLAIEMAGGR